MFSATHQLRRQIPPTLLLGADRRAPTGTFRISQVDLIAQVASCEACSPDAAEVPFECILDRMMQFFRHARMQSAIAWIFKRRAIFAPVIPQDPLFRVTLGIGYGFT